jgi:DNA-binding NtrC family response regulator
MTIGWHTGGAMSAAHASRPILLVHGSANVRRQLAQTLAPTHRPIELARDLDDARRALARDPELILIEQRLLGAAADELFVAAQAAGAISCVVLFDLDDIDAASVALPAMFPVLCLTHIPHRASALAAD